MAARGGLPATFAWVVAFAMMAGCFGDEKAADATKDGDAPGAGTSQGPLAGGNVTGGGADGGGKIQIGAIPGGKPAEGAYAYALAGPQRVVAWANDSFAPTDGAMGNNQRVTNITQMLEMGVPTLLVLNLSYAPPGTGRVTVGYRIMASSTNYGGPGGLAGAIVATRDLNVQADFVPKGKGPFEVVVGLARAEAAGDLAYSLRIEVIKLTAKVLPDTPVEVPIAAEGGLILRTLEPPEEDELGRVTVALWGPDDRFIGRFSETGGGVVIPLPKGALSGDHVLMVMEPREGVTVEPFRVGPENLTMNPLEVVYAIGEKRTVAAGTTATWDFTPPPGHIQVGVILSALDGSGNTGRGTYKGELVGRGPIIALDGPAGRRDARLSIVGHENLTSDPYTVTVTTTPFGSGTLNYGGNFDVEEAWYRYVRD